MFLPVHKAIRVPWARQVLPALKASPVLPALPAPPVRRVPLAPPARRVPPVLPVQSAPPVPWALPVLRALLVRSAPPVLLALPVRLVLPALRALPVPLALLAPLVLWARLALRVLPVLLAPRRQSLIRNILASFSAVLAEFSFVVLYILCNTAVLVCKVKFDLDALILVDIDCIDQLNQQAAG